MGIFSNIVSFGAGYTLGAKTGDAPIRRLQNTIARGTDRSRTPGCFPTMPRSATS